MRCVMALWALGLSCTTEEPEKKGPLCKSGDVPELHIGTGSTGFVSLGEGEEIGLVHGPQGGFHVEVGLRATYLDASEYLRGELIALIDGEERARTNPWFDFSCTGDGLESWGTLLIFQDATPAELDGQVVTIEANVTDADGVTIEADEMFVIYDLGQTDIP